MGSDFISKRNNTSYLSFVNQYLEIKKTYRNIESDTIHRNRFEIVMNIMPSDNSSTYKVKLICKQGRSPIVILLSPLLEQKDGKYPHHIYKLYKSGQAKLCVYYPGNNEWDNSMSIATTFIPWISTWLNAYEYWLITGEWHYDEKFIGNDKKEG